MNEQPNYYAIIPADVRYNNNLTFLERFLYCEITALSNINGYCFASNEYFSKLYDKKVETISRALKKLKDEKHIFITYEEVGTKKTNRKIYPLTNKEANDIIINGKQETNDIFVNGELQKILSTIDKKVKYNNITYKEIFNTITNINKDCVFDEDLFNTFYANYPKKKSKEAAKKAFKNNKVNQELLEIMLIALEKQKYSDEWLKENGRFIPFPATWLNQKRWEDDDFVEKEKVEKTDKDTFVEI